MQQEFNERPEERVAELINNQLIDITSGFPAKNPEDFEKLLLGLHDKGVSFIPLAVTKEGKIFMWTGPVDETKSQNIQILEKLGDPTAKTISFFAAIQGLSPRPSDRQANIILKDSSYAHVGFVNEPRFEVNPQLNLDQRMNLLRPVFEAVPGVRFEPPVI